MSSMNGWVLERNHPTTDREVQVLVKYARETVEQEIAVYRGGHWFYKNIPDDWATHPILNRVLCWMELPELPTNERLRGLL